MVINKRAFLLTLALLGLASSLFAQAAGSPTDERFIQRLAWNEDENTLRYEVIIEKEENARYVDYHQEITTLSWINASLEPGNYRYRVIPYNFLNRPGEASPWISIEIRPALMPEVENISPDTLYLDTKTEYVITISGKNIEANAEIELRRPGGAPIVPLTINFSEDGRTAELFFAKGQLTPGIYEGYIRNSSGPETRGGAVSIAYPEDESAASRLNTLGASFGMTFTAPLLIGTVRGTLAPWRYSFLEIGLDFGFMAKAADVGYHSFYPFAHYALYVPFTGKFGWYAGAGAGYMFATYNFPEEDIQVNVFAADVSTGFNLFNFLDISYTLRTSFKEINHKFSLGYVYRFGK